MDPEVCKGFLLLFLGDIFSGGEGVANEKG